jgi:queuosine precursor transporter
MNELLFFGYILTVSSATLGALWLGKEALIGLICVEVVLVNLFVSKEITLFGLTATASDALAVGIALGLNVLQEYYQKITVQKTILISFACTLFYVIISLFQIAYKPAPDDANSVHFEALLSPMPRVVIASLVVYLIVQYIDCHLYGKLCSLFENRFFIFRNYSSIAFTQLIDTILFSFLGLYKLNEGFDSLGVIFQVILVSYVIKVLALFIAAPFLGFTKKLIRL